MATRRVDRSVGVAGGPRKYRAILGALRDEWINVLIPDQTTTRRPKTPARKETEC